MRRLFISVAVAFFVALAGQSVHAQYKQVETDVERFPEEHDYQKKLRAYLATLTEKDFAVEFQEIPSAPLPDADQDYRLWLLSLFPMQAPPLKLPAASFTLASMESKKGLILPTIVCHSQSFAWMANWDYPLNPYRNSRALKLRAFVLAAADVAMLDYLYEHAPQGANRADYLGGNLIWIGYTYGVVKDILPAEARAAFEEGIKKHVMRIAGWGPTGQMTDMDLFAPVGLWYVQSAMKDPEVTKVAEEYSKQLFSQPRFFNPAGYFVDNGCFDTSYNGISLYFSTWAALASDWGFVQDAVRKSFLLRAHLCFPDPDGEGFSGPSHPSSRTSGDPPRDQWNFAHRAYASAMVSDDAIHLAKIPAEEVVKASSAAVAARFNDAMSKPVEPANMTWRESHWSSIINQAYEHYKPGSYARLLKLQREDSPLLKPLYLRPGSFIHQFDKAFVIAKFDTYAAAVHTGPVGRPVGHNGLPYGYGGGQLSTFWTAPTGVVIAGRRRGVQGAVYDNYAEWRDWPNHEVIGLTSKDELASSARIQQPEVTQTVTGEKAVVKASGNVPKYNAERKALGESGLQYERTFTLDKAKLRVQTQVTSDGKEQFAELYETIPVFLRETAAQAATKIEFEVAGTGAWAEARAGKTENVEKVRLNRFKGAAIITFAKPQTIVLSEKPWKDGFQTQAECWNLRIDLLAGQTLPATIKTVGTDFTVSGVVEVAAPAKK
ncbi:MAG: hypothetical protein NTW19_14295 [Planctomycetota bacterium]|nr:hypothetical protein [Planctomycetota bacterium]